MDMIGIARACRLATVRDHWLAVASLRQRRKRFLVNFVNIAELKCKPGIAMMEDNLSCQKKTVCIIS